LLSYLGIDKLTPDEWAEFERERGPAAETLELGKAAATVEAAVSSQARSGEPTSQEPAVVAPPDDWREALRRANAKTRNGAPTGAGWNDRRR